MGDNQPITVGVLREELEKQGDSIKRELRGEIKKQGKKFEGKLAVQGKKFEGALSKQEKRFEAYLKEEGKKYRRHIDAIDGRFQSRQGLMVESITELKNNLGRVKEDVKDIREMVGKNTVDIEIMKVDIKEIKTELKTKVGREELPQSILLRKS